MQIDLYFPSMDRHMVQAQCSFQSLWVKRKGDHFFFFFFLREVKRVLAQAMNASKKESFPYPSLKQGYCFRTESKHFWHTLQTVQARLFCCIWLCGGCSRLRPLVLTPIHSFLLFSLTLQSHEKINTVLNAYKVYLPSTYFNPRVLVCRRSRNTVREINKKL